MPRKTRRRISGTRKSRRIRRRGTRRSGTRIRGGNRRYHNRGGFFPTSWSDAEKEVQNKFSNAKETVSNAATATVEKLKETKSRVLGFLNSRNEPGIM